MKKLLLFIFTASIIITIGSRAFACVDPWDDNTVSVRASQEDLVAFLDFVKSDYEFEIHQLDKDGEQYNAIINNKNICNRNFSILFDEPYLIVSQSPYTINSEVNNCADLVMDIIIQFQKNNNLPELSRTADHAGC